MIKEPTKEQQKIIDHPGNAVVTAKPGSGKTFTVVEKIGKVLTSLPDHKGVIAISFTNKASDELKKSFIRKVLEVKGYDTLWWPIVHTPGQLVKQMKIKVFW